MDNSILPVRVSGVTTNEVERALAAPISDRATILLRVPEDQWFDRKSSRTTPIKLAPHLVAFANADGGDIVIGLNDGIVEGLGPTPVKDYQQAPYDFTVPPVRAQFQVVDCQRPDGRPAQILLVRVAPSERVHELPNGDCYLRVGDESRKLRYNDRRELEFDKGQAQFDGTRTDATTIDLDHGLLEQFKRAAGAAAPTDRLLQSLHLRDRDGAYNYAAVLLFAKHPQHWLPEAYVRIIRFAGTERGTGSRLNVVEGEDHRVEGPIPTVIHRARAIIRRLLPRLRALSDAGLFEPTPIVPEDAWLEGLVNAVIHRSYSLSGDHIRVEIYDNRIEIESPGRFPGLADPRKPEDISRFARNPRIARVCAELRIGQELGEGIRRIFHEMRARGLTDPMYDERGGSVRLTLTNAPRLDPHIADRLPNGAERVLDIIRAATTPMGTGDIADAAGVTRPTAKRRLDALQQEGLVRWIGRSPRDPRAHWVLTGSA